MTKIKISTDSTSDIPASFREELNISVLPLTILADGKEYRDGVDITPAEFYKILDEATVLPVSSQVRATEYLSLYQQVAEEGYTDLIHVSINAKGSGTYQAAVMSRDMFFEEHPEVKLNIHIIDSRTYSVRRFSEHAEVKVVIPFGIKLNSDQLQMLNLVNMNEEQINKFRLKRLRSAVDLNTIYQRRNGLVYTQEKNMILNAFIVGSKKTEIPLNIQATQRVTDLQTEGVKALKKHQLTRRVRREIVEIY